MMEYTYKKAEKENFFEKVDSIEFHPVEADDEVTLQVKKGEKYWKEFLGIPFCKRTAKTNLYSFYHFLSNHNTLEDIKEWTDDHYGWPRFIKDEKLYKCARVRLKFNDRADKKFHFEDNEKAYKKYEECLKKCEECGNFLH